MTDREINELFEEYKRTGDRTIRNRIIEAHRWLALSCAKRYRSSGEPLDDLIQVAQLGLVKAAERFDPAKGVKFATFASVTARGELRRHFRDATWSVKVPRPIKDLYVEVKSTIETLSQRLGRQPLPDEVAAELDVSTDAVLDALDASSAYRPATDDTAVTDTYGSSDPSLATVEVREVLREAMADLTPRDRKVVYLRYYRDMTQAEIAREVGCSQVHVSRILQAGLARLPERIDEQRALAALDAAS